MNDRPAHSPFVQRLQAALLTTRIAVLVEADGRVLDVHVAHPSGTEAEHLVLDGALVQALRRFHFRAGEAEGRPQRGWSTIECALQLAPARLAPALRRVHG
jgi:outer membrane biosynthesis protein TonB